MSYFKDSSFVLEILKDFSVHLQVHFKDFSKDGVQTVEEHSCLIFGKVLEKRSFVEFRLLIFTANVKFLRKFLIFFKHRASDNKIQSILQNMLQNPPSIQMLHILSILYHGWPWQFHWKHILILEVILCCKINSHCWVLYLGKMFNILNAFLKVWDSIDQYAQFGIQWYLSVDVCLSVHETAVRVGGELRLLVFVF